MTDGIKVNSSEYIWAKSAIHETTPLPDKKYPVWGFNYNVKTYGPLFALHYHSLVEIIYLKSGEMTVQTGRAEYVLGGGDLIFINPDEYHFCPTCSSDIDLDCVIFDLTMLGSMNYDRCDENILGPIRNGKVAFDNYYHQNALINGYFAEIFDIIKNKEQYYEATLKAKLMDFIVYMLKNNVSTESLSVYENSLINRERIAGVVKIIEENYDENLTIDFLSKSIHINKYYLCKLFKDITGTTIIDYLSYYRINKAITLLVETDMTVSEIATTVGYNEINYFSRIFKKYMGYRPTDVRK